MDSPRETVTSAVQTSLDVATTIPRSCAAVGVADDDISAIDWSKAHDSHAPTIWARLDASARERFAWNMRHERESIAHGFPHHIANRLEGGLWTEYDRVLRVEKATGQVQHPTPAQAASRWLTQSARELRRARPLLAFDEWELKQRARMYARHCALLSVTLAIRFAERMGVNLTRRNGRTQGARWQLTSAKWWIRKLRKLYAAKCENVFRTSGWIHRLADCYISQDGLNRHRVQAANNRRFIAASDLIDKDTGELFSLEKAAAANVSNPSIRIAEFMVRVKGFEAIARKREHAALFFTLTAPSAYHRTNSNGEPNPRYEGFSVADAQTWLRKVWARARAKLKRLSVMFYGFRVAEAHHDATPHWHLLLFAPHAHAEQLAAVIRRYWLSEYADERGAELHRSKCVPIDLERIGKDGRRAGAIGYIAKYISKAVDGRHLLTDDPEESSLAGDAASERVVAWARVHGIRQFQQLGGPSVTLWREFRRLREKHRDEQLERIRAAVDAGDFAEFIELLGGIEQGRTPFVKVVTEREVDPGIWALIDYTRREADLPVRPARVVGIRAVLRDGLTVIRTRTREFLRVLSRSFSTLGPVAITVRGTSS
jgi:hypothetical protein